MIRGIRPYAPYQLYSTCNSDSESEMRSTDSLLIGHLKPSDPRGYRVIRYSWELYCDGARRASGGRAGALHALE